MEMSTDMKSSSQSVTMQHGSMAWHVLHGLAWLHGRTLVTPSAPDDSMSPCKAPTFPHPAGPMTSWAYLPIVGRSPLFRACPIQLNSMRSWRLNLFREAGSTRGFRRRGFSGLMLPNVLRGFQHERAFIRLNYVHRFSLMGFHAQSNVM